MPQTSPMRDDEVWDAQVADLLDTEDPEAPRLKTSPIPFVVDDARKADWALMRVAQLDSDRDFIETQFEAQMYTWHQWKKRELERLERQREYFTRLLESYFLRYRETHPRQRTLKLPHGALKIRKMAPAITITQEDLFLTWAEQELPSLVRVKKEPDKKAIRHAVIEDGLALPGVIVTEMPDKFQVEAKTAPMEVQVHDD